MWKVKVDCIVNFDLYARIGDKFEGTLEEAMQFARQEKLALNLLFDYAACYTCSRSVPVDIESKNRSNWELYQTKEMFSEQEYIQTVQYKKVTVWITYGHIKQLLHKYRTNIHKITWEGLELFERVKKVPWYKTEAMIIVHKQADKLLLLGVVDDMLLACRQVQNDSANLPCEIDDTVSYLTNIVGQIKACQIVLLEDEIQLELSDWYKVQYFTLPAESTHQVASQQFSWKYYAAGVGYAACVLYASLAVGANWDVTQLNANISAATMQNQKTQEALSAYPDMQNLHTMQEQSKKYQTYKQQSDRLIKFLSEHGNIIQKVLVEEDEMKIDFRVKPAKSYDEFVKVGELLGTLLTKKLVLGEVELLKDVEIGEKTQIYKFQMKR